LSLYILVHEGKVAESGGGSNEIEIYEEKMRESEGIFRGAKSY
jgi:hypothetical protein